MENTSSQRSSFDQWLLAADDNLYVDEIKRREAFFIPKFLELVSSVDSYHQLILLSQSLQMVLGGLKPVTSFVVDKKLYSLYKSKGMVGYFDMKSLAVLLFELFDVRLEQKKETSLQYEYYVYNPRLIAQLQKKHPKILRYNDEMLSTYIANSLHAGVNQILLMGLLFGIPMSAVKQYSKYMTHTACRLNDRLLVSSYGEGYYVWGQAYKRDVIVREKYKELFFMKLASSPQYRQCISTLNHVASPYRELSRKMFEYSLYMNQIQHDLED
ncbi:hypothetical protein IT409_02315 [Candidatus Falkowbacteria bacterium]|nr:hypothetical protein [Candidatus Falkowbacteria bacterium]